MNKPLPYEREVLRSKARFFLSLWRRQGRKTTNMAKRALKKMMKRPNRLVTFCSASILVGKEMLVKESQVIQDTLMEWQRELVAAGLRGETNVDKFSLEDFQAMFQAGRIEAKFWHSKTTYSRTLIIAPSVATARGFSGDVMMDEIGFIPDFKDLWEAMEPIASSNPDFTIQMATTPPNDDGHYSYELAVPEEGTIFTPDAAGHWYRSQAGVMVHRADVYDTYAAGLKLYDLDTGGEISPQQHRLQALDREAWDRNYALIFKSGGTAAVSLAAIHVAMQHGRGQCVFAEDAFPLGWRDLLGDGKFALGYDVATTENGMSNPSSLTVMEQLGNDFFVRLKIIWKTADPDVARAMIREALELGGQRRAKRLCIDASNERYFAVDIAKEFRGQVIVELVVSGESFQYGGQTLNYKTYLGNQLINAIDDGHLILPESRYVKDDYRLVKRDRGGFATDTDSQGRHGDTFDSDKLALHGLISRGGPVEASAQSVGTLGAKREQGRWKRKFSDNTGVKLNA